MRSSFVITALLLAAGWPGRGFANGAPYQAADASNPSCRSPEPSCEIPCRPPCPPCPPRIPEQPLAPQQPVVPVAAPGMFVQPPATGTVNGPVEQRGIEGAAITFPSLTLKMPSLRLPAMSRSRTNARMDIDAASAPYQQGFPASTTYAPTPAAMPMFAQQAPQQSALQPQQPANSPQQSLNPQNTLPQPPLAPTPPPDAPYSPRQPSCDAPRAPYAAPSCDAKQAALDEKLRRIEMAEQRLAARIAEIQQLTETLANAERRAQQTSLSTRANEWPPHEFPAPGQLQAGGAPTAGPASYTVASVRYVEPARLPANSETICEPRKPSAQITGLRR